MIVVMGNGKKENVAKSGTVFGTSKDQEGNSLGNISHSGIMYLPNGKYNLISITHVMKNGWKLEGNDEKRTLTLGSKNFNFNIKIHTTCGTLFAVCIEPSRPMNNSEINALNLNAKILLKKLT